MRLRGQGDSTSGVMTFWTVVRGSHVSDLHVALLEQSAPGKARQKLCLGRENDAKKVMALAPYRPHCLLLDISMPRMDGCTVARQIRQQPELASVKLVALTAYSVEAHAPRIQEAGFDHHVIKSANPDELERLLTTINEALRLVSQTKEDVTQEFHEHATED